MVRRVALVGTGLIGASVGLAARAAGLSVIGTDADPAAAAEALRLGALGAAVADVSDLLAQTSGDTVLVLAVPLGATLALLARLAEEPPAAVFGIDVASVKVPVARAAAGMPWFVPTHPLAGSERSGPGAARPDLFAGRTWTYEPGVPRAAEARAFIERLGAVPVAVEAGVHDRVVAATSHLPQVLAVALGAVLADRLGDPYVRALSGPGLRSSLRLAASPWSMWSGILGANREAVAQEVRSLAAIMSDVADELAAPRPEALERRFAAAARAVAALDENGAASSPVLPEDHRAIED